MIDNRITYLAFFHGFRKRFRSSVYSNDFFDVVFGVNSFVAELFSHAFMLVLRAHKNFLKKALYPYALYSLFRCNKVGGIKLGQTSGHPNTPVGAKAYYKPSLGKMVLRKAGVLRRSERVLDRNRSVRGNPPAGKCGHKGEGGGATPWSDFTSCLAENMPTGAGRRTHHAE